MNWGSVLDIRYALALHKLLERRAIEAHRPPYLRRSDFAGTRQPVEGRATEADHTTGFLVGKPLSSYLHLFKCIHVVLLCA